MRVLVIDDNLENRALVRRALEKELPGIEIEEIRDSEERSRALEHEDRARLLAAEREARAAAEAAGVMKDEFLATLSHELRTPLNAIVGWARLLRSGTLDGERTARALETIERSAHSQSRLIEDLLDVSSIISGKMSLEVRPVQLAPILDAALDAVRPAAEAKAIQLGRSVSTEPVMIPWPSPPTPARKTGDEPSSPASTCTWQSPWTPRSC